MNRKLYEAVPSKNIETSKHIVGSIVLGSESYVLIPFTEQCILVDKMFEFMNWLEDNAWTIVYSENLKKRAYVDASKHDIYVHGSSAHFERLVKDHGKSAQELYAIFSPSAPKQDKQK